MENMDKELTAPKWVLIVRPKIPQIPLDLSAQNVCPSPKVLDFNGKRLHWVSVVREQIHLFSKSLSNFVFYDLELHNRYCHTSQSGS